MYRRRAGRQPSPYLVSKLRRHEALQRRCGPGTAAYSHAQEQLRSGKNHAAGTGSPECKYLVSISYRGLGNRILAAASAFLYAVLTDRVLLVDPSNEMGELFCEPFPGTTWVLPPDFPLTSYTNFSIETAESHANMVKNKVISPVDVGAVSSARELPAFAYIHLDHDATGEDKQFYCDEDQSVLRDIRWLVMRTDSYIVPGLFLVMAFQEELGMLFPEPDTVFHHLGRYLFHPSNHVWGLIARYHDAYLAAADQRVGIQVRVFGSAPNSPELLEQITTCAQKEGLLPELLAEGLPAATTPPPAPSRRRSKAVLVTSLKAWYYDKRAPAEPRGVPALRRQVARHQGVGRDISAQPHRRAGDQRLFDVRVRGAGPRRPHAVGDVQAGQRLCGAQPALRPGRVHGAVLPRAAVLRLQDQAGGGHRQDCAAGATLQRRELGVKACSSLL
uniref:Fucosyltransferase n=1 Tax=Aegilops tauschii subsp. strangulata TaxID=200361 RepID=A0A453R3C3_AEGTS